MIMARLQAGYLLSNCRDMPLGGVLTTLPPAAVAILPSALPPPPIGMKRAGIDNSNREYYDPYAKKPVELTPNRTG